MDDDQTNSSEHHRRSVNFYLLVILCTYIFLKWLKYFRVPHNFPPGPPSVPFLGSVPFIKSDFRRTLEEWREDYGDIVGLQMGSELSVVLSDFQTISESFKDDKFTGRPKNLQTIMAAFFASGSSYSNGGATTEGTGGGIVFSHGAEWREQRRFALRNLKDKGFGKSYMEPVILEEVRKLTKILSSPTTTTGCTKMGNNGLIDNQTNDKKVSRRKASSSVNHQLSVAVVNSLWSILTGERIGHEDDRVKEIVAGTDQFIKNENLAGPLMIFPWLRHLPFIAAKFRESKSHPMKMRQLQDDTVNKKKASFSAASRKNSLNVQQLHRKPSTTPGTWPVSSPPSSQDGHPLTIFEPWDDFWSEDCEIDDDDFDQDYIDIYLKKIGRTRERKSSFYRQAGITNLQRSLTDLFGAGSETSSSVLLFAFLYMIKHPDVQAKVHAEIDSICGDQGDSWRPITLSDRAAMSYTDAVLHEVLRHSCLVYVVPHATTEDTFISAYNIPRETAIYANVWAVMHNPMYWMDPENFRPERFLDESGNFQRNERCIPFMIGKRHCIGQTLAQNQLFLFFTGILQRFRLKAPNGPMSVSTEPIVGFIHSCPDYEVEFETREVRKQKSDTSGQDQDGQPAEELPCDSN